MENEMVGLHHWINGHEFEQTLGDSKGQGNLACCNPWGHKELYTTERLTHNTHTHSKINMQAKSLTKPSLPNENRVKRESPLSGKGHTEKLPQLTLSLMVKDWVFSLWSGKGQGWPHIWACQVAPVVKNLPANAGDMFVRFYCKANSVRMILWFLTVDFKTVGVTKATVIKPLPPGG